MALVLCVEITCMCEDHIDFIIFQLQRLIIERLQRTLPETMVSLISPGLPPLSLQDILDNAGRLVDKFQQDDRSYPDLASLLNITSECE